MPDNQLDRIYQELGSDICLYPFFGAFYQTNNVIPRAETSRPNSVRPCSIVRAQDPSKWDIVNQSIVDARNSPAWKQIRADFLAGKFHDIHDCRDCSYNERSGTTSPRQMNNKFFSEKFDIDIVEEVREIQRNDLDVHDIIALDYYPSNYCNYQCIMCAGGASSQRQTFEVKFMGRDEKNSLNAPDADFWEILDRVSIINFTGGETVLQKQVLQVMDHLINNQRADSCLITLLTNASSSPNELTDRFQHFQDVIYNVSIDGTGDVIEYQRRGCDWPTVEANSLEILNHTNIGCVINFVLTSVNVLSAMDFVDWCYDHNIGPKKDADNQVSFINISPVFRVDELGMGALPPSLREIAQQRLQQGQDRYRMLDTPMSRFYVTIIQRVLDVISNTAWSQNLTDRFVEHIRIEDKVSKKKLVEVVPEWQPWFI
jgi:MoaA/NifB/PqqE/SkfB family radical SAM enzyme